MNVTRTVAETRAALAGLLRPLGFVPTMGALHEGHLALVAAARASCATVVASLFVNPTQFSAGEDLGAYPRDEAGDLESFEQAGIGLVFAPAATELYPSGFATAVSVRELTEHFEGSKRPDHFSGVALVVTKLFNIVRPDAAFFGQKDAQQLAVVRRLARDLDLPVEIVGVPTVREHDGLAMSSRNAYLTADERAVAPDLYRALLAGAGAASRPGASGKDAVAAAASLLLGQAGSSRPSFSIDYLATVDADTFTQTDMLEPHTLLIAAARLGKTRLLDNISLSPSAYPERDATA
ncbi:MAG TPA: pantoate--beta-alanine ligase [Thermoleophilia bacterium]|nr:pantoate--beta-alanine ligase [Thermoleophilia bacterium]